MTYEELIRLGLTEAQATEVEKAQREELKGYIPKVRFDEINNELKDFKKIDIDGLRSQVSALEAEKSTLTEKAANDLNALKLDYILQGKLRDYGAKNIKSVMPHIDVSTLKLGDNDTIDGIDDVLNGLKTSAETGFLFDQPPTETDGKEKISMSGFVPAAAADTGKPEATDLFIQGFKE